MSSQVEQLRLLQELNNDGLKMARVYEKQAEVISDPRSEILIAGGNRGSKTFCSALRFAAIARDIPVQTMDGKIIDCRLPHQKGRPLTMWCVGDHLPHIGQVLYPSLFEDGLFYKIRDEQTGGYRSWNPVQFPNDRNRKSERELCPPLIPKSEIAEYVWHHKAAKQFICIRLKNGTEIFAFASSAAVKQGVAVDEIWLDEHIVFESHYAEWLNRLSDKEGRLVWSTIPRDDSWIYDQLKERAETQKTEVEDGVRKKEDQFCIHHVLSTRNNPFIPESEKKKREEQMSERDRRVRLDGESSTDLIRVYQDYNPEFHCVNSKYFEDKVAEILRENNWEPPNDWCRFLTLDPGTQKPAILFVAIPPEDLWLEGEPFFIPYDEIYVPKLNATEMAEKVNEKHRGRFFEKFFIDGQAARQTPMGFAWTIGRQYEIEFEEAGLQSRYGSTFEPGDPNFHQRAGQVRRALRMRQCGIPQLRILNERCPHLVKQMLTNKRKLDVTGEPTEHPADNQRDDVRVCLEYTLSRHPKYRSPPVFKWSDLPPAMRRYRELQEEYEHKQKASSQSSDDESVLLGMT